MAHMEYSYNVATDFPNGQVNVGVLTSQILRSTLSATTMSRFDGVAYDEGTGVVRVLFTNTTPIPASDLLILDGGLSAPCGGILGSHNGSLVRFEPTFEVTTTHKGLVQVVEWFGTDLGGGSYTDLAKDARYVWSSGGTLKSITTTEYVSDGGILNQVVEKFYTADGNKRVKKRS